MRDYLLTGRTGVGKSSFINYALRADVAATNRYRPCTSRIESYDLPGVRLLDTPGLAEAGGKTDTTDKNDTYLAMVTDHLRGTRPYGFVYITQLSEPRFRPEEQNALLKLTTKLGAEFWSSAWLLLTFAADVRPERRHEAARHRHGDISDFLRELTSKPGYAPRFEGFRAVLMIDNVTRGWSTAARPLLEFFTADGVSTTNSAPAPDGPVAESYFPFVRYWENADRGFGEVF